MEFQCGKDMDIALCTVKELLRSRIIASARRLREFPSLIDIYKGACHQIS
jgi:hypothetical protein